jgi:hypothetical protein
MHASEIIKNIYIVLRGVQVNFQNLNISYFNYYIPITVFRSSISLLCWLQGIFNTLPIILQAASS